MNSWVIVLLALVAWGIIDSLLRFIEDVIVAKHVSNNLEVLGAMCALAEDENEEEVEE